ncbi:hypothetical protein BCR42DRAFT_386783 [Absidia repens]|uniref:Uncharacterized protein n=1 Tax=Absidia repens TaxID=90262 RepID=A0A1X2J2Z2_9FUNG|nr:hypothetical protein BCR42DRAFT_386783 [Absidia repens]
MSFYAQNYRPIIRHKRPSEQTDKEETHSRNAAAYDYDDLMINTCEESNTNPCYIVTLDANMDNGVVSSPCTFKARLDNDDYYQLVQSRNGKSDIVYMEISSIDHYERKNKQPWYQRWKLWGKNWFAEDNDDETNGEASHLILGQLISSIPDGDENDRDQRKNIFFIVSPFSPLDDSRRQVNDCIHSDYNQKEKRSIENDAVMQKYEGGLNASGIPASTNLTFKHRREMKNSHLFDMWWLALKFGYHIPNTNAITIEIIK